MQLLVLVVVAAQLGCSFLFREGRQATSDGDGGIDASADSGMAPDGGGDGGIETPYCSFIAEAEGVPYVRYCMADPTLSGSLLRPSQATGMVEAIPAPEGFSFTPDGAMQVSSFAGQFTNLEGLIGACDALLVEVVFRKTIDDFQASKTKPIVALSVEDLSASFSNYLSVGQYGSQLRADFNPGVEGLTMALASEVQYVAVALTSCGNGDTDTRLVLYRSSQSGEAMLPSDCGSGPRLPTNLGGASVRMDLGNYPTGDLDDAWTGDLYYLAVSCANVSDENELPLRVPALLQPQ